MPESEKPVDRGYDKVLSDLINPEPGEIGWIIFPD
jgi:hypothetical protein